MGASLRHGVAREARLSRTRSRSRPGPPGERQAAPSGPLALQQRAVRDQQGQVDAGAGRLLPRDAHEVVRRDLVLEDDEHPRAGARGRRWDAGRRSSAGRGRGRAAIVEGRTARRSHSMKHARDSPSRRSIAKGVGVDRAQDAAPAEVPRRAVRRIELQQLPLAGARLRGEPCGRSRGRRRCARLCAAAGDCAARSRCATRAVPPGRAGPRSSACGRPPPRRGRGARAGRARGRRGRDESPPSPASRPSAPSRASTPASRVRPTPSSAARGSRAIQGQSASRSRARCSTGASRAGSSQGGMGAPPSSGSGGGSETRASGASAGHAPRGGTCERTSASESQGEPAAVRQTRAPVPARTASRSRARKGGRRGPRHQPGAAAQPHHVRGEAAGTRPGAAPRAAARAAWRRPCARWPLPGGRRRACARPGARWPRPSAAPGTSAAAAARRVPRSPRRDGRRRPRRRGAPAGCAASAARRDGRAAAPPRARPPRGRAPARPPAVRW